MDNIIARCIWWGEDNSNGAIFRPRVLGSSTQDNKKLQTTAKYMVRSGPKQFNAYLNGLTQIKEKQKKILRLFKIKFLPRHENIGY